MNNTPPEDMAIDYAERIKSLSESFGSKAGRDCWNAAELIIWLLSDDEPRKDVAVNALRAALAKDIIDAAYKHAMQVINETICTNGNQPIVGPRLMSQYNASLSLSTPYAPE
jgi:hypothetical protein